VGSQEQLDQVLGPNGALEALAKGRERGLIRFIGVTGHSRPILEKAVRTGLFDTVQHPFNPIETEWLDDVIPAAREENLGIIGMKPLAGGAFKNIEQALLFNLTRGVDVVIPGMDSLDQVNQNIAVGRNIRPLSENDFFLLDNEKDKLKGDLCRRCAYCMPCPNGLNIPMLMLLYRYYDLYDLRGWAHQRLGELEKHYKDCAKCGECVEKCPYDLPVPDLMGRAAEKIRR
jgi:predicted aldo/keto reductase-like oxidoreductase